MNINSLNATLIDAFKDYNYNFASNIKVKDLTFYKNSCSLNPITKEEFLQEAINNLESDGISILWFNTDDLTLCTIKLQQGANLSEAIAHCDHNPDKYWKLDTNLYLNID